MIKIKTNSIFIITLAAFVFVLSGIFYVMYQISLKTESVKIHYAENIKKSSLGSIQSLQKEEQDLAYQESILKTKFLSEDELVSFITTIENVAAKNNLNIEISKVERGAEEIFDLYTLQPVIFSISIVGTYDDIKSFVSQITLGIKLVEVAEFKLYKFGINKDQYNGRIILKSNTMSL